MSAVYQKCLRLNLYDKGKAMTLMTVDAERISSMVYHVTTIFYSPILIAVNGYLFYRYLGLSFLSGVAVIVLLVPLNVFLMSRLESYQTKMMEAQDKRVKKITELLQGILVVKLMSLAPKFCEKITLIRNNEELRSLLGYQMSYAFVMFVWTVFPTLFLFSMVVTYVVTHNYTILPASKIFPVISAIDSFGWFIFEFPALFAALSEFLSSSRRVQLFLSQEELGIDVHQLGLESDPVVDVEGASFRWRLAQDIEDEDDLEKKEKNNKELEKENEEEEEEEEEESESAILAFKKKSELQIQSESSLSSPSASPKAKENSPVALKDRVLTIPKFHVNSGELVAIIGAVGSGKSSFLAALLSELEVLPGSRRVVVHGRISYTGQTPWIRNDTLRNNVVCGTTFSEEKYDEVLECCCLKTDLDSLPAGDQTEIGERGVNLSGGQKQRVALARAVYLDSDVYLLDDPLSAVDAHVAKHIFEKLILGYLKRRKKLVVLVSHQLQFLPQVDRIYIFENLGVKDEGSYSSLLAKGVDFVTLIDKAPSSSLRSSGSTALTESDPSTNHNPSSFSSSSTSSTPSTLDSASVSEVVEDIEQALALEDSVSPDESTDQEKQKLGLLINKEERYVGGVSSEVYKRFLLAVGSWPVLLFIILMEIVAVVLQIFSYSWLSIWSAQQDDDGGNSTTNGNTSSFIRMDSLDFSRSPTNHSGDYSPDVNQTILAAISYLSSIAANATGNSSMSSSDESHSVESGDGSGDDEEDFFRLWFPLLVFLLVGLGLALLSMVKQLCWAFGFVRASRTIHHNMLESIVATDMNFFQTTPLGRIINRFSNDMQSLDVNVGEYLTDFVICMVTVSEKIILVTVTLPLFLLVLLPLIFIYRKIQVYYNCSSREVKRLESISNSPIYAQLDETIEGLTTIRAFSFQQKLMREYLDKLNEYVCVRRTNIMLGAWLSVTLGLLSTFVAAVIMTYVLVSRQYYDITTFSSIDGLILIYALSFTHFLGWGVKAGTTLEAEMAKVERIFHYTYKLPIEEEAGSRTLRVADSWPSSGVIRFQNASVQYSQQKREDDAEVDSNNGNVIVSGEKVLVVKKKKEEEKKFDEEVGRQQQQQQQQEGEGEEEQYAIRDVTFETKPKERVAIVGRTGSGKTTIMMSLFRIIGLKSGSISIDGVNIDDVPVVTLRDRLSIIPQEAIIFSGTVRSNLDPTEEYSDAEVWRILELCQLKKTVESLPGKLRHEIVNATTTFSAGQKQLLCMARAAMKRSKVLVLDEATASIDAETDSIIQKVIREDSQLFDRTILTVAHRLPTIIDYDRVLVLDRGKVVEFDTPYNLLQNKDGHFTHLVEQTGRASSEFLKRAARLSHEKRLQNRRFS